MNRRILKKAALICVALLPVVFFFINVIMYSVNLPFRDDYTSILLFLNQWVEAKGFFNHLSFLLEKHYGQMILWNKTVSLLIYSLLGKINFIVIIIIGNIGLIFIIYPIYKIFKQDENKLLLFLPSVFLFFQPMYSENIYQAMASLCNFYVLTFGMLSLWLLSESDKLMRGYFYLSIFFTVLSAFTQINGFLFLFLAAAVLFYQKKWKDAVIITIIAVLAMLFYRFSSSSTDYTYSISFSLSRIKDYWIYFFTFIGSNFGANENSAVYTSGNTLLQFIFKTLPVFTGFLISAYFVFLTAAGYYKKNIFIYTVFIFLFLSAAGAAVTRIDQGMITAISSRYRVLTILFLILTYLSLMEFFEKEKWKKALFYPVLIFSIVFCIFSYTLKSGPIREHRNELIRNFNAWKSTGTGLGPLAWPVEKGTAESILEDSIRKNIYKVPENIH